jgi:hypothetical protein
MKSKWEPPAAQKRAAPTKTPTVNIRSGRSHALMSSGPIGVSLSLCVLGRRPFTFAVSNGPDRGEEELPMCQPAADQAIKLRVLTSFVQRVSLR